MISIQTQREHTYPIFTGKAIFSEMLVSESRRFDRARAFVVTDENVWKWHESTLRTAFGGLFDQIFWFQVPAGETSKSMEMFSQLMDFLLSGKIRRSTPIFVIGGGVTGDLGGFAAASVLRGVPFIQVPTTLLAMVDSSVGGKTGINHRSGKNLIGAFYQPEAVLVELNFLDTLPQREWTSGLGEVVKYAAIRKPGLFTDLMEILAAEIPVSNERWIPVIETCIQIKADIVTEDELETGARAWLNFGHTFAHAIEATMEYRNMLHGEAVYLGMIAAAHLSNLCGNTLPVSDLLAFKPFFNVRWPEKCLDFDQLIHKMGSDKKNTSNDITFVLLQQWGQPYKQTISDSALIVHALRLAVDDINR